MDKIKYLQGWADSYRSDLTENILPFWFKHGLDTVNGGIYTCLDRDGSLYDTTKSVWFQGRFAFVCAYAYNNVEQRSEYLDAARRTIDFIEAHCADNDGHMYFEVTADGSPLRKRRYVFSESFAAIAMSEYAIATGNREYAEKSLRIFRDMQRMLNTPGYLPAKYEEGVEMIGHSITMILINVGARIRDAFEQLGMTGDWMQTLQGQIDESIAALKHKFLHPEFKALLETVKPDGEFIDTQIGRIINPGHCIETAWFLLEEARYRKAKGQDGSEIEQLALQILDWSWDWGWDKQYGGLINFRDCKNWPCQDYSQDMKFWWPQTEAIICTLYAYYTTNDEKYLKMHREVSEWTYGHFPDHEHGEWYGYLHRDGTVAQPAKGNIFKGPFHIPRMMVKSFVLCNDILNK